MVQANFDETTHAFSKELRDLAVAVWNNYQSVDCPPEAIPTAEDIDLVITADAWAMEAREEFASRWTATGRLQGIPHEVSSISELVHQSWVAARERGIDVKHPLAPLIQVWQTRRPLEVSAVRDSDGSLRADAVLPRVAMRNGGGGRTDRLYLPSAHFGPDGTTPVLPGFEGRAATGRIPVLPVNLYDLGVAAGEARGGGGAAPIPARMLVKLAAAPSSTVRHGDRFVTYELSLRDLRDALYPPERLDSTKRKPPPVSRMWPRIREAIRVINQDARIPLLDPATGYGHYHHLMRISENFGRIDMNMPIRVVLDIPPEVEGGVKLPIRLDQWGAESAPGYRALIGLAFAWHEPGRTHAPDGKGNWRRKTSPDVYDPITDDDAIALAYPSSAHTRRRELVKRAWQTLERLEEHGELRMDGKRILPPKDAP